MAKRWKILSLLLALVMVLGTLAGCKKSEEPPAEEPIDDTPQPLVDTIDLSEYSIVRPHAGAKNKASTLLNEAFTSLLETAYNAGYEQGKADASIEEDPYTWVDFGLPSGKLWGFKGSDAPTLEPFKEDAVYPTKEEMNELRKYVTPELLELDLFEEKIWLLHLHGRNGASVVLKRWRQNERPLRHYCDIRVGTRNAVDVLECFRITVHESLYCRYDCFFGAIDAYAFRFVVKQK
jgi:hypothetical protein